VGDLTFETEIVDAANIVEGIKTDGVIPIKIIGPGWGSSGFYSQEVLERDKAVFEGVHMYWDHPTKSENDNRPERSLKDLAAVTQGPITFKEDGPAGPGLYGQARVFAPYRESVAELAPYIGVSIRAQGTLSSGEKEGRKGPVVEGISSARSVDFVTKPGAGGKVLELFESARGLNDEKPPEEEPDMGTLEEAIAAQTRAEAELRESQTALEEAQGTIASKDEEIKALSEADARKGERILLSEARTYARTQIAGAKLPNDRHLPDVTVERLTESLSSNPPVTDSGELDTSKFDEILKEGIKSEVKYLGSVVEGGITNMGGSGDGGGGGEEEVKNFDEKLTEALSFAGMSESATKHAVGGR